MSGGSRYDSSGLPERGEAARAALALRRALDRYQRDGSAAELDLAFAAAAGAVAELRGERAGEPPEVSELKSLFHRRPLGGSAHSRAAAGGRGPVAASAGRALRVGVATLCAP